MKGFGWDHGYLVSNSELRGSWALILQCRAILYITTQRVGSYKNEYGFETNLPEGCSTLFPSWSVALLPSGGFRVHGLQSLKVLCSCLLLAPYKKEQIWTQASLYLLTNMNIMWAQACQHKSSGVPFKGGPCSCSLAGHTLCWCTQPNFILMYINRESLCWISQLLSFCKKKK